MKKIYVYVFLMASVMSLNAQGRRSAGLFDNWSMNLNLGVTSFYGDISVNDGDILKKYTEESAPAYSLRVSKFINDNFGIGGQVLYGNLKGTRNYSNVHIHSFNSKVLEYNFSLRYIVTNSLMGRPTKLNLELYSGMGQFFFKTTFTDVYPDDPASKKPLEVNTFEKMTPEFVYFFGGVLNYNVTKEIALTMNLGLRQAHNDKMDGKRYPTEKDKLTWDYYTHTSFGVTYKLRGSGGTFRSWKNTGGKKGRILAKKRKR